MGRSVRNICLSYSRTSKTERLGGKFPKWNEGLVKPIYKKGDEDSVENYREIVMNTGYKIYTEIQGLVKELEEKEFLADTQMVI